MDRCIEYIDEVMAITAIPVGNIPATSAASPALALTPVIEAQAFNPPMTGAVTIGLLPAAAGVALVPIRRMTGKAKDDESDSVAGRLHTVTVTCEADTRDTSPDSGGRRVWDRLLALERGAFHLLLLYRDGTSRAFVSATEDTYQCTVERDGSKTSVTFRLQNMMGIQPVV